MTWLWLPVVLVLAALAFWLIRLLINHTGLGGSEDARPDTPGENRAPGDRS